MSVYRYQRVSVDAERLQHQIPGLVVLGSTGPWQFVDLSASAGQKADLDEYMASQGFAFHSTDPSLTPSEEGSQSIVVRGYFPVGW